MFEKIIAIKNVNQSEAIVVLTLLFLTYVPTKIIIKYHFQKLMKNIIINKVDKFKPISPLKNKTNKINEIK